MRCLEFEKIVIDLAHGEARLIDISQRQTGLAHAENCARCAARLANEKALNQGFRQLIKTDAALAAAPKIEATLLAAFRNRAVVTPVPVPAKVLVFPARPRFYWAKWAMAAAAVLLIAFGVARALQPQPPDKANDKIAQQSPTPTVKEETPAPVPAPREQQPSVIAVRNSNNFSAKPKAIKRNFVPKLQHNPDHVTVEVGQFEVAEPEQISAKDFMVFDYAATMPPPERSQIMRVKFPRENLAPLGIPIPVQIRNRDFINTDLLVGSDGVPRAIRVVNK